MYVGKLAAEKVNAINDILCRLKFWRKNFFGQVGKLPYACWTSLYRRIENLFSNFENKGLDQK